MGESSKDRSRCALRWRKARVGVRVSDCILLIYICRIPQPTTYASEKENASISENALSRWRSAGSVQDPADLTELLLFLCPLSRLEPVPIAMTPNLCRKLCRKLSRILA